MGPTAHLCSHRLHWAATLERRSHCPVAPAVPLLVAFGTVDSGQYMYRLIAKVPGRGKQTETCRGKAGEAEGGWTYFSVLRQVDL